MLSPRLVAAIAAGWPASRTIARSLSTSRTTLAHVHGPGCNHGHSHGGPPPSPPPRSASGNRGVVYVKPGVVEVRDIAYPILALPEQNRKCNHGVIIKCLATNICGSDQHMVRGRTTAPSGLVLGHEITGEVVECGSDVEFVKKGDIVSVPFNIACGRCANCKAGHTGICLTVNPARPGLVVDICAMGEEIVTTVALSYPITAAFDHCNLHHIAERGLQRNTLLYV